MILYEVSEFEEHLAAASPRIKYPKLSLIKPVMGFTILSGTNREAACKNSDLSRNGKHANERIGRALQ